MVTAQMLRINLRRSAEVLVTQKSQSLVHGVLLTVQEVAGLLSVSQRTVRRMIAAGEFPVLRLGRAIRVRRIDIEALIGRRIDGGGQ